MALHLRSQDRPRRRLREVGAPYLSTPELLAVVLAGTPAGEALELGHSLVGCFGGLGQLSQATLAELCQVAGIGPARASQVLAALELGRRQVQEREAAPDRPQIVSPAHAARYLHCQVKQWGQEEFFVLLLDTQCQAVGCEMIYRGTVDAMPSRQAEILRPAVRAGVPSLILAHTHPSGRALPSPQDKDITRHAIAAGQIMGIAIKDHLVLVPGSQFHSLREHGDVSFSDD